MSGVSSRLTWRIMPTPETWRLVPVVFVLLTLYAKSKTDNITGAKLKEIRRVLES